MPPPKLARDTPVLDVVEPVEVGFDPALGMELNDFVTDSLFSFFDTRIFKKPLVREAWLDGDVGTFGEADVVFMFLCFDEVALFLKFFDRGLASFKTIHAPELLTSCFGIEGAVGVKAVDDWEVVALADFEVEFIVGGSDLEHPSAEILLYDLVGDDGDFGWL